MFGERAKVNSFEWSTGGLFNKIFKINTTEGDFILKMECDEIFFATRKEQIENEVYGNELFRRFGIPCPKILAHEFTKNGVGTRYVFMEHIKNEGNDCPLHGTIDRFDESIKAEIERQFLAVFVKMREMTSTQFGGVSPTSILGRHEGYDGFYRSTLNLLIKDSENCGVFTGEELDIVKKAAEKPLVYEKKYVPTFVHGDLGYHNAIWGSTNGGGDHLYIFDFGNAFYGLPYFEEHICKVHGADADIVETIGLDRNLYDFDENLIIHFERMFWRVSEQLTNDYAYGRMADGIEAAKKDTSRAHITDFVDRCRKLLS